MTTEQVPKITVKKVCPKIGKPEVAQDLFLVVGIVEKYRHHHTDTGFYPIFTGRFFARNLETGQAFNSKKATFPTILNKAILAKLQNKPKGYWQVVAKIGIMPADTLSGMDWTMKLLPITEYDPLAALVAAVDGKDMDTKPEPSAKKGNGQTKPTRTATRKPASSASPRTTTRATRTAKKPPTAPVSSPRPGKTSPASRLKR